MSKFIISKKSWDKIQNYSKYAWEEHGSEIGGFMIVNKDKNGNYEMSEPVILEQEISAGNTTITKQALASYYCKTAIENKTDNLHYCWWHSHHTMSAFWSGTDLTAIEQDKNDDWSCSLVVNLKGEYKFRVSHWQPIETFKDIEITIQDVEKKVPKAIASEVDKLCTKETTIVTKTPLLNQVNKSWDNTLWYDRTRLSSQVSIFHDEKDAERVDVEAKYDDLLTDYIYSDDFSSFKKNVKKLNQHLIKQKSELRVGSINNKEMLDSIINVVDADQYIYTKGQKWNVKEVINNHPVDWRS